MSAIINNDYPIIVTARMNNKAQLYFNDLREWYLPPNLNYLKAHLTLFHKLPGKEIENIKTILRNQNTMQPCKIFFKKHGNLRHGNHN